MLRQLLGSLQTDSSFLVLGDAQGKQEQLNVEYRVLTGSLARCADIGAVLEEVFRPAKGTEARAMHYRAMTAAMQCRMPSEAAQRVLDTRLLSVIDQVANFATAVQSDEEAKALLQLLEELLRVTSDAFDVRCQKAVPKITSSAMAQMASPDTARFGLLLLQTLLSSSHRTSGQNSLSSIRASCLDCLDVPILSAVAADCVALTVMADNTDNWTACWRNYIFTAISVVQALGIAQHVPLPKGGKFMKEVKITSLSGPSKALHCERVLLACCLGLQGMLSRGCSTGPVATELNGLMACAHAVLSMHADLSNQGGSKHLVENDSGVSIVDIALVLNNIKISLLELIRNILSVTPPATLYPVAMHVCRSVTAAVSSRDMSTCSSFSSVVLHCVADVIATFPTAIVKTGMFVDVMLNHFKIEIRALTSIPAQGSGGGVVSVWKSVLVMKIVRQLLLFCGSLLTADQRGSIEYCIAVGLACLSQGVCSSACATLDRKVRRVGSLDNSGLSVTVGSSRLVEPIRISMDAQIELLELATADILCPGSVGTLSGNIAMFKLVAECLSTHMNAECRVEARRALAVVDGILHPTAIALPAVATETLRRSHLAQRESQAASGTMAAGVAAGMMMDAENEESLQQQMNAGGGAVRDLYSASGDTGTIIAGTDNEVPMPAAPAGKFQTAKAGADGMAGDVAMAAPFKASSGLVNKGTPASAATDKHQEEEQTVTGIKRSRVGSGDAASSDDEVELPEINME